MEKQHDNNNNYDLAVVGAGPAGLAASITFAQKGGRIVLIEKNEEAGKKLLATGNGRCNITNTRAPGYDITKEFFEGLGIVFAEEDGGRVYPMSRQASVVRDALVAEAVKHGVEFRFCAEVSEISRGDTDDFIVSTKQNKNEQIRAAQVIIATGGKAGPQYGSTGDGLSFARSLGITVNSVLPALTMFAYSLSELKGVRAKAHAALIINGIPVAESMGEVQFTEKYLSGICVFDLSREYARQLSDHRNSGKTIDETIVELDLAPGFSEDAIAEILEKELVAGLSGLINSKLASYITKAVVKEDPTRIEKNISFAQAAARMVKAFEIPVSGTAGWKDAQVTFGGVDMSELDEKYFESANVPGLYFAGEVLSPALPTGGYNLDYAWNTGIATGARAAGFYAYTQRNKA